MKLPVYSLKLVRDRWATYPPGVAHHPQVAALFFHRLIGQAACEHSAVLYFSPKLTPLGASIIAIGGLSSVPMIPREVFKGAILANASGVMVAHNHPSGLAKPSPQDIRVMGVLVEAGTFLGIKLLDDLVVGPSGEFTSMKEAGLLAVHSALGTGLPSTQRDSHR